MITLKDLEPYFGHNHQVRFVDYEPGAFTAPCLLTKERAERLCDDHSVTLVKINLPNGSEITITNK